MNTTIPIYFLRSGFNFSNSIPVSVIEYNLDDIFKYIYKFMVSKSLEYRIIKILNFNNIEVYDGGKIKKIEIPDFINIEILDILEKYKKDLENNNINNGNKEKTDKIIRELELAIKNTSKEQLTW